MLRLAHELRDLQAAIEELGRAELERPALRAAPVRPELPASARGADAGTQGSTRPSEEQGEAAGDAGDMAAGGGGGGAAGEGGGGGDEVADWKLLLDGELIDTGGCNLKNPNLP